MELLGQMLSQMVYVELETENQRYVLCVSQDAVS